MDLFLFKVSSSCVVPASVVCSDAVGGFAGAVVGSDIGETG